MNIDSIQNGIVIDHIRSGGAMELYHLLGLGKLDCPVAIIKNAPSDKMGKKDILAEQGLPYVQETELANVMPELDVLYMTRVQRERFFNEEDYLRLKDSYILTPDKLRGAKADLTSLHPLPRVNEIDTAIDADPRACYFRQALNGKFVRMALIMTLLGLTKGADA